MVSKNASLNPAEVYGGREGGREKREQRIKEVNSWLLEWKHRPSSIGKGRVSVWLAVVRASYLLNLHKSVLTEDYEQTSNALVLVAMVLQCLAFSNGKVGKTLLFSTHTTSYDVYNYR